MRIKNKEVIFLFGALLLAIVTGSNGLAQSDEKGSSDHPLIARFPGSSIMTYDLKQFNSYLLPLGKMSNDTLEKSQKMEGKVTQITYAAPKDRSVIEIFRNYEAFLKNAGFVILFSSKKDELGAGWLSKFLAATPRAYRYGAPALNTRMEGNFNYLVAKMTKAGGDVYVALCVATSWYQDFPVIQVDVIETAPMDTGMMKVNPDGRKDAQGTNYSQPDQSILKNKNVKSFDLKIGFSSYSFSEPTLEGSSNNFRINQTGIVTGTLTGFRLLIGPYINVRYYFNENFGISLDLNSVEGSNEVFTFTTKYTSYAGLFSQKVGLIGQFVGKNTPVRLSSTLGIGNCIINMDQQTVMIPSSPDNDIYLKGKASKLVGFFNINVSFPIYKKLFLFGNYEFNFIPVGSFVMEHDGGSDYSNTLYNMDFGGSLFRAGLGYTF